MLKWYYLISDFDKEKFENRKKELCNIINKLNKKYNNKITYKIEDLYYNVSDILIKNKKIIEKTLKAISNNGLDVKIVPHRGCTDGTNITMLGIPCFNLGTGVHNYHSFYEFICLEDIIKASDILIEIVRCFSENI